MNENMNLTDLSDYLICKIIQCILIKILNKIVRVIT